MKKIFNHIEIEQKWQKIWHKLRLYKTEENQEKKYYSILEMFLYPSGDIHMGHARNYTIGDAIARFKKAQGFNILHSMGWDAFGLPAENAAIQNKLHPNDWTIKNIKEMKTQLQSFGFSYDWSREINTSQPDYYKHEQAIFIDFFKKGLVYQKESYINWDPVDRTVLANEQVINGKGWRSGAQIEKKKLRQWFLRITNYADELLDDLDKLINWPDKVKTMQKNWIGRSNGTVIKFKVSNLEEYINTYSTRPEMIFGTSFICLSYNHKFVKKVVDSKQKVEFIKKCKSFYESNNLQNHLKVDGLPTGYYVNHPYVKEKTIPIYIVNYLSPSYETGAKFACPAHDLQDFEFAKKYNLKVLQVILKNNSVRSSLPFIEPAGKIVNSSFLNNLHIDEARLQIIKRITLDNIGKQKKSLKLQDWGISRQRYWGCPIPIIYCQNCGVIPILKKDLPIELPKDISLHNNGNCLQDHPTWKNITCYKCGADSIRETDTLDTFFESSWYFLKFCNPATKIGFNKDKTQKWLPINQYIGGIEHAILHLLYARFFTKALRDCHYLTINEPFEKLLTQGMVCQKTFQDSKNNWLSNDEIENKNGSWVIKNKSELVKIGRTEKMSKSKKNIVRPINIIKKYGADSIRLFLLSDSPPTKDLEWSDKGIKGVYKYLNSVYNFIRDFMNVTNYSYNTTLIQEKKLLILINHTIHSVTINLENFTFNKAIADTRTLTTEIFSVRYSYVATKKALHILIKLLSIFTPHIAEEMNVMLGESKSIFHKEWPAVDYTLLQKKTAKVPIQINGKTRAIIDLPIDCDKQNALTQATLIKTLNKYLGHSIPKKVIYIKNKVINFVH